MTVADWLQPTQSRIICEMRQLLLLRHAKSSWDDPTRPDRERPLNRRGQRAAAAMRQAIRDLGLVPELVLVSPARRTLQTLEALEPWDQTPLVEPTETLYLATATQLLSVLHGVPETVRSVLLIGHNPGLHELAVMLAGRPTRPPAAKAPAGKAPAGTAPAGTAPAGTAPAGTAPAAKAARRLADGFPTGALAEFTIPADWWGLEPGGGRLVRFLTPREVEAAQ